MTEESRKGRTALVGGWLFLFAVALLYLVVGLSRPDIAAKALGSLGALLPRVAAALAFVFVLLVLGNLFVDRKWVSDRLGAAAGVGGWSLAVVSGILSMGSLYAWYPLLGELREKGMSAALVATFLYARALKLPLLPMMVHYFGLTYTIVLSCCIVVFSVASGIAMGWLDDRAPRET